MAVPERARLASRVALVTGAGGGLGRAYALALARCGARVVVNDFGPAMDGSGCDAGLAERVVAEIRQEGGEAVANAGDVGCWAGAEAMVAQTIAAFGALDILINNAGILRPRTIVGMQERDIADVLRVHLFGTLATSHFAALHWRDRARDTGPTGARLINTTSASGLFSAGQANYDAAKAGIAAMTGVAANELARYGVTANAIAPMALSRMSSGILPERFTPAHASELVCWLASAAAQGVTGRVFNVGGGHIGVVDRWHTGQSLNRDGLWQMHELDSAIPALLDGAAPHPDLMGYYPDEIRPAELPELQLPRGDRQLPLQPGDTV